MTEETNTPTNTPTDATPPANEEASADLGLQDLVAVKSIIDLASSRGAFKPNEMVAVGTIYSKLENFLLAAQKQSQAAQSGPQGAPNA